MPHRVLLAIESSCDETAAAIIDENLAVRSSVVASQTEIHGRFGGVVPEMASRAHVQRIVPVIDEALRQGNANLADLSAIAVVTHPGLVGSLLVGLTAAKTLAFVLEKPLIAVNHIEAHLYACRMHAGRDVFPAVGLVVSGGHSNLYDCPSPTGFELLGSTIDDAAGEAFDKVAVMLGLAYPGGPSIQAAAEQGSAKAFRFPRTFLNDHDRLEFSFSGLKTSVLYEVAGTPPRKYDPAALSPKYVADLAASFQEAVVDVLVSKCQDALRAAGVRRCWSEGAWPPIHGFGRSSMKRQNPRGLPWSSRRWLSAPTTRRWPPSPGNCSPKAARPTSTWTSRQD